GGVRANVVKVVMTSSRRPASLEDSPGLEQTLEIFLSVIFEFDLAALATRSDGHVSAELLLELRFPLSQPTHLRRRSTRMLSAQLSAHERLGSPHGEPLELDVSRHADLLHRGLEAEERAGMASAQCFT